MAVISVDYNEAGSENELGYKSVQISHLNGKEVFNSGNFVKDWYNCLKFIVQNISGTDHIMYSSSVDHFIMDGAPYSSAYLHMVGVDAVLKYVDMSDPDYLRTQQDIYEGIELFVPEGTQPTWEELKKVCE